MPARSSLTSADTCLARSARTKLCCIFVALIFGTKLPGGYSTNYSNRRMLLRGLLLWLVWVTGRTVLGLADLGVVEIDERATLDFHCEMK